MLLEDSKSPEGTNVIHEILNENGIEYIAIKPGSTVIESVVNTSPKLIMLCGNPDGYALCKQLKNDPRTCNFNIVMFNAHHNRHDVLEGFCLGAVDYISLDSSKEEIANELRIRACIDSMIEQARQFRKTLEQISITAHNRKKLFKIAC